MARFIDARTIEGLILAVDHFGNLITNIHANAISALANVEGDESLIVELGGTCIQGVRKSYQEAGGKGLPLAILGSRGFLEIAVNKGNAQVHFSSQKGDRVIVLCH